MSVTLSAELIEAFAGTFLSPMYDDLKPTPACHRDWWGLYCSPAPLCAIAAPRGHAKSTALTHDFILAAACFRVEPNILLISATEDLAMIHLGDIAKELRDNDDLRKHFGIRQFIVDSKGEIVIACIPDADHPKGYEFRITARGAGQKLRGTKWRGRRPGLIICDDIEEDEQVENADRRKKFRTWVLRVLLPLGRRECRIRWHGTILHEDSMLMRLINNKNCLSRLYRAHKSFNDFSEILWPEMWGKERLWNLRQHYIEQGDSAGYSQELLNDPYAVEIAFFRRQDFLSMSDEDHKRQKRYVIGVDFAVSKRSTANLTSFTVGGQDSQNIIHIVDQRDGQWDTLDWIDEMFALQNRYDPIAFFVEDGVIWKSVASTIYREMPLRNTWLNCVPISSTKNKGIRAGPLQKRHKAGGMRFDKESDWYSVYEEELLHFNPAIESQCDDRLDSTSILVRGIESLAELEQEDFMDEEEFELATAIPNKNQGRSLVTGY